VSAGTEPRRAGHTPPVTGYKVLIVDDERPVLELVDEVLHVNGFETSAFVSPVEALKKARRQKFDALVLDLYMPEMSGMLFHAKLKIFDPELASRTVFISGYIAKEELRNHLSGNPTFLEKPFKTDDLVTMVRSVLPPVPRQVSTSPPTPRTPSVERS
jgi:CheY-like chemotaxis protein